MTHHHSKRFLSSQSLDCEVQKQSTFFFFGLYEYSPDLTTILWIIK